MILKIKKPTSPGVRHLIKLSKLSIAKKPVIKKKLIKKKINYGKTNSGKIVIKHKGGGNKKRYRVILSQNQNLTGIVYHLEYDPNRNCPIIAVYDFKLKMFFYSLAPKNLKKGDIVKYGNEAEKKTGHCSFLSKIPIGSYIFNVSGRNSKFAKFAKSAGSFCVLLKKTKTFAELLLNSGFKKKLPLNSFATIGIAANEFKFLTILGKAGKNRWLNKRPAVRGVAKNPIDHPNGGGEGKKSGKRKTPWGKIMPSRKKNAK